MSQRSICPCAGLPASAREVLAHWKTVRGDAALPNLRDLAPIGLPPAVLPWTLIYRRAADGSFTYGVVGEELVHLFGENPRGKSALHYADPAERKRRYDLINKAIDSATPYVFHGGVLFDNATRLELIRVGLPAQSETGPAVVLIYFPLGPLPMPRLKVASFGPVDHGMITWCTDYAARD